MVSKNVEFFSAFYVSALNDAVKKFLTDNNAAVVSVDFKILPADIPKNCQFAASVIWYKLPSN